MRVFDWTTYLEPPPGSDDPYIAVPGRADFRDIAQGARGGTRPVPLLGGRVQGMLSPDIMVPIWEKFILLLPLGGLNR